MTRGNADELNRLIDAWERAVELVEHGYDLTFDDYLNDMDGREMIRKLLPRGKKIPVRVARADQRFRAATRAAAECVWGEKNRRKHDWTPARNWWYFALPIKAAFEEADE